ncbi:hypothetical protein B484DRAFT_411893, partial [Ochromonadaceae sp. CCMP2298]
MQENFKTAVAECKSFKPAGNGFTPKKTATPAARVGETARRVKRPGGRTAPRGPHGAGAAHAPVSQGAERGAGEAKRARSCHPEGGEAAGEREPPAPPPKLQRASRPHYVVRREGGAGTAVSVDPGGTGATNAPENPTPGGGADDGPVVIEQRGDSVPPLDPGSTARPTAELCTEVDLENEALIPPELLCTLEQLEQRISVLFPESSSAGRAYRRDHYQHNRDAAIQAVGEFHFSAEALARDAEDFAAAGEDLDLMLERRLASRHQSRLNPA